MGWHGSGGNVPFISRQALPMIMASDYGVSSQNTAAQNYTNLQALIDRVHGPGSGGTYGGEIFIGEAYRQTSENLIDVSATIEIPDRVRLRSAGSRSGGLRAGSGFPDNASLIEFSGPTTPAHGYHVTNMMLDCASKTGATGIKMVGCQEQTRVEDVLITGVMASGIEMDAAVGAGIRLSNIEIYTASTAPGTAKGINMLGGIVTCDNYTFVGNNDTPRPQAGLYITSGWFKCGHMHVENVQYGVHAAYNSWIMIDSISPVIGGSGPIDDLIRVDSSEVRGYVLAALKGGETTNLINDVSGSFTLAPHYLDAFFPQTGAGSSLGVSIHLGKRKIQAPIGAPEGLVVASRSDLMLTTGGLQKKTDDGDSTGFVVL